METLIIGAGAAGIAAAHLLADSRHEALILEARNRLGGRIHTDETFADFPLELGAEFIHGGTAPTHELVQRAKLNTAPVVRMDNLWWAEGDTPAQPRGVLPENLQSQIAQLLADYYQLAHIELSEDISLAQYLRQCGYESLAMADVLLAQTCCASIDSLSCADIIREMRADHSGHGEARIREGYTALLDWYSRDLQINYNQPVTEIHWNADGVTVICDSQTYQAQTCIVTVPVSILQQGIRFTPALPVDKQQAIDNFRMEPATKLVYRFSEQFWSDELTFMAHDRLTARWWTPSYRRENAAPILCTYVTAERARTLDAMDESDALAVGLDDLSKLLGVSLEKIKALCVAGKRVSWAHEPYTLGGYAHVPPHHADFRPILARAEGGVLFFAGEATAYDSNPQTVHGAFESGWRVAHEAIAAFTK